MIEGEPAELEATPAAWCDRRVQIWRSERFHRAILALLLLANVYFAIKGVRNALRPEGSDFTVYWNAGRAFLAGRDPLEVEFYIYLPFFAACMVPFALLPLAAAAIVWQLAGLTALVWIVRAVPRLLARDGVEAPAWIAWAPLAVTLRLCDSNFSNGQVNLLVFAALLASMRAWQSGHPRATGAWLALATAAKIVPGVLAVHLVLRRAWKELALTLVAVPVLVLVVPSLRLGVQGHAASLAHWWSATARPYAHGGNELLDARRYVPGQSLTATAYRLLTASPATSRGSDGPSAELVDLDPGVVHAIVVVLAIGYAAVLVASLVVSRRRAARGAFVRELALVVCTALTLAPLVHKAHMVWLILPVAVALAQPPAAASLGRRRWRVALMALGIALIALTTPALFGRVLATRFLSANTVFFGLQAFLAVLVLDVWTARAENELEFRS